MDADKIKNFFIHHCEKMVMAVFVVASLFLIYLGLQQPNFLAQQQPEDLTTSANQVKSEIDENHNENIVPERRETEFDVVARTKEVQQPVDASAYAFSSPFERKSVDSSIRRRDPELLAPRELQVQGELLTIAGLSRTGEYPLQELENAEPLERVEEQPNRRNRGRNRRGGRNETMEGSGGSYGGAGGGYGGAGGSMEGAGGSYEGSGGSYEGAGGSYEGSGGSYGGSGGSYAGSGGSGRKFNREHDFGMRPTTKEQKQPVPEMGWFIAGTAVVPHRELTEAYKSALQDASSYDPSRDQPSYFNYQLQRADVTNKSVDELTESDWVTREDRRDHLIRAYSQWAGVSPEVVPSKFRDSMITGYIPPVLLDDYTDFALHPLVPVTDEYLAQQNEAISEEPAPLDLENLDLADPGARGGMSGLGGGSGGYSGGGMESQMGMMGMGGSYAGGSGGGMSMRGIEKDPADYKLMRFYDFFDPNDKNKPEPGREYVYRVRFAVIDPNFPANPRMQPKASTLSADVYDRVSQLMAAAKSENRRQFQRWSEWSEPSRVISLPDPEKYYAGPVEQDNSRRMQVGEKEIDYVRTPPTAKMVVSQFNHRYKVRMPMWMDVTEGSVLSKQGDAEVVDPITLNVKTLPDQKLVSGTTVINLDGGRPLSIIEDEDMTEPGVMLLFDEHGGLTVTDEVSDHESYRIWSFADERGL